MTWAPGTLRGSGRFRIANRLGGGATGEVFEAVDNESQGRVALKALREASPDAILLLKREFRTAQDLHHPNLVALGELLEEAGQWFFTMELVDSGVDFLQYVAAGRSRRTTGAPPRSLRRPDGSEQDRPKSPSIPVGLAPFHEARLRQALTQLVSGLRALHLAGKVHRDVKPSNILVTREGRVVLLDFGIVADTTGRSFEDEESLVGTPYYMAPEQITAGTIGPATDWYAVGVLLYQALTGQLPFSGSVTSVMSRKLVETPPPPRALFPGVSADLDALCVDLLAVNPDARPQGDEVARRLGIAVDRGGSDRPLAGSRKDRTFVGRRKELATLTDAFAATRAGKPVVLLIEGESGVGKTALADHFSGLVAKTEPDLVLLRGRCYERESVPYKAVDDVIDTLAQFLRQCRPETVASLLPDDLAILCRSFPVFATALDDGRGPSSSASVASPREQRARLFGAMRQLLGNLGSRWPVAVMIDDLHWADTDSIGLLADVLRPPGAPRLLLVCTMRSETAVRAQTRDISHELTSAAADVRVLHLEKLPNDDAVALARALAQGREGSGDLDAAFVEQILAEAQGLPLFIDELVRWRMTGAAEGAVVRLDDILWQRVRALDPAAQRFLELTAVAAVPIPQEVVSAAAGLDRAKDQAVVQQLRHAHLLDTSGKRSAMLVQCYHDRIRSTIVGHMPIAAVRVAHGQLAVAAEQTGRADVDFLFTHWEGANNSARAAEYARIAGDRAMEALAFARAAHVYRRALELGGPGGASRRETQLRLAEALTYAGHEAEAALVRLDLAKDAEPIAALDLRRRAAEQMLLSGHFDRGKALLREVFRAVHERFPESPLAVLCWLLVVRMKLRLRGFGFQERDPETLDKRSLVHIDALWSAGAGLAMSDNIRGAYFQTKNLLLAMKVGDVHRVQRALAMEVCFQSTSASRGATRTARLLREARRVAERVGTPEALAEADTAAGYVHYFLGRWSDSIDALLRAEVAYRDRCQGVHWQLSSMRTILYRALSFAGRIEDIRQRHGAVLRDAAQRGDIYAALNVSCSAAFIVALADDRPDDAARVLDEARKDLPTGSFLVQHYYHLLGLVQLDLYAGRAHEAGARLRAAMPTIKRSLLMHVESFRAQTADAEARSALAEAAGGDDDMRPKLAAAARATRALAAMPVLWAPALAKLYEASRIGLEGRRDDAVTMLRAALTALDDAGLQAVAAATRRRLGQLLGGDEGHALVEDAEAFEMQQGIVHGDAFANMYAPGLGRLGG
jgi:hypothetical protein